jgi:hypothetical protein
MSALFLFIIGVAIANIVTMHKILTEIINSK